MLRVMIVDDIEIMRTEIRRLKVWGEVSGFYIASEASNGYEALQKLEANPVDVIITDIRMPKVNGIELLQKVMERKLASCVILLSEYGDFNYARQGIVFGVFDYIVKPVDECSLANILCRAKKHITERNIQEEKIRLLENKMEEKEQVLSLENDVNRIIEMIRHYDSRAISAIMHMIDAVILDSKNNTKNIANILEKELKRVIDAALQIHPWLCKFVALNDLLVKTFSKEVDLRTIKTSITDLIDKITKTSGVLFHNVHENSLVNQLCTYVLNNIDADISLKVISQKLYVNKTYLSEVFKVKTGITIIEYIKVVKMERAKRLIEDGFKVYEIAEMLNYKDVEYFSRLFKNYTGQTPSDFKKN